MNNNNNFKALNYASLNEKQEKQLRDLEKNFNSEFNTDYYLMVVAK